MCDIPDDIIRVIISSFGQLQNQESRQNQDRIKEQQRITHLFHSLNSNPLDDKAELHG